MASLIIPYVNDPLLLLFIKIFLEVIDSILGQGEMSYQYAPIATAVSLVDK